MPVRQNAIPLPHPKNLPGHLWHPSVILYTVRDMSLSEAEHLLLPFFSPPWTSSLTTGSLAW